MALHKYYCEGERGLQHNLVTVCYSKYVAIVITVMCLFAFALPVCLNNVKNNEVIILGNYPKMNKLALTVGV